MTAKAEQKHGRNPIFTRSIVQFLSDEQFNWLENEVARRKTSGITSDVAAAHGGNHNVNKGMLIREALEKQFHITKG